MSLVSLKNVSRFYDAGEHKVKALSNVNLELDKGKVIVIFGTIRGWQVNSFKFDWWS